MGSKPGERRGGRQKGTPNKISHLARAVREARFARDGMLPLDYMLAVMRNEDEDPEMRFEAAKAAAPYMHARLVAAEVTGKDGGAIETKNVTNDDLARWMAFVLTGAANEQSAA